MQQWGSWEWGNNRMQKKCLIFHKQRNHRMHTTNNVPQSRCRAFLIYGELSEMGRWSKRRWRHAEGLHFSLFSPHKQEKAVSVCHNTHTHKHTPTHTHRSKTQAHAQMQTCSTPTVHMHASHRRHHFHDRCVKTRTRLYTPLFFSNTFPLSPATHSKTHMDPSSTHTSSNSTN